MSPLGPSGAELREKRLDELLTLRTAASEALFSAEAERIARCCHAMSDRFARGGRLLALAAGETARTDAAHVAVEFVHPVIVGKRALPALMLTPERVGPLCRPDDIVVAFADQPDERIAGVLERMRASGAMTIAFGPLGAEWRFEAPSTDPFTRQELLETVYHVLWELVHVFFEHRGHGKSGGVPGAEGSAPAAGGDPTGFLYPFLSGGTGDLDRLIADVRDSLLAKAAETARLREVVLAGEGREGLLAAAGVIASRLAAGGVLLAFGNGGSATDAADLVCDLSAVSRPARPLPAIDLSAEPAVITATANDVGVEQVFARQLIAHGRPGDVAVAISTSGSSPNLIAALRVARERGLATVALCGYEGGALAVEGLADALVVVPSDEIPRIQEAQATACHAIVELVGRRA
jgi:D-sedoheptulose 7-phosphate isomerase